MFLLQYSSSNKCFLNPRMLSLSPQKNKLWNSRKWWLLEFQQINETKRVSLNIRDKVSKVHDRTGMMTSVPLHVVPTLIVFPSSFCSTVANFFVSLHDNLLTKNSAVDFRLMLGIWPSNVSKSSLDIRVVLPLRARTIIGDESVCTSVNDHWYNAFFSVLIPRECTVWFICCTKLLYLKEYLTVHTVYDPGLAGTKWNTTGTQVDHTP